MLNIILERSKNFEMTQFYFGKNKYVTIAYIPVIVHTVNNNSKGFCDISCSLDEEKIKVLVKLSKILNILRKFYAFEEYLQETNSTSEELYSFYEKMLPKCNLLRDKFYQYKIKLG